MKILRDIGLLAPAGLAGALKPFTHINTIGS